MLIKIKQDIIMLLSSKIATNKPIRIKTIFLYYKKKIKLGRSSQLFLEIYSILFAILSCINITLHTSLYNIKVKHITF